MSATQYEYLQVCKRTTDGKFYVIRVGVRLDYVVTPTEVVAGPFDSAAEAEQYEEPGWGG